MIDRPLKKTYYFRETGIKTKRYHRGGFLRRDENDKVLDEKGNYRPQVNFCIFCNRVF